MNDKVRSMWKFFEEHRLELRGPNPPSSVTAELDRRIGEAGGGGWEIGHHEGRAYLAISPNDDSDAPARIVAAAPQLPDWDIRRYKPPKDWSITFKITVAGRQLEIDGSQWEVVCFRFADGMHDVVFKPPRRLFHVPADALLDAALTIVDGELGEEARRSLVSEVDLTGAWKADEEPRAQKLVPGLLAELIVRSS